MNRQQAQESALVFVRALLEKLPRSERRAFCEALRDATGQLYGEELRRGDTERSLRIVTCEEEGGF